MTLPPLRPAAASGWRACALASLLLAASPFLAADKPDAPEPNAAYMQPLPGLGAAELKQFRRGEAIFRANWLVFPAMPVRNNWEQVRPPGEFKWGLGPTFMASSCMACHVQAGHGKTADRPDRTAFQQLLRLSLPGTDARGGPKPHPAYGDQLQVFDVISADRSHVRQGEADVFIDWQTRPFRLADGTEVELRRPQVRVASLSFGPLGDGVMTSLRNTRAIFGLGYLESVDEEDILAIAAAQASLGLRGRPNFVRDDDRQLQVLGRFGWKANQPGIRQQIAAAFHGDMGVTSPLYPAQNCPPVQVHCKSAPPGDRPELYADEFDDISFWARALDAPPQRDAHRPEVRQGGQLFTRIGCADCHRPTMKTGARAPFPALANKVFHAYTDLLLHDMGPGLADGRPDFRAGPQDWRTPPLWGIGLSGQVNGSTNLLHDGRARSVQEAILWHGGEAGAARDAFARLDSGQRAALIAFVNSL